MPPKGNPIKQLQGLQEYLTRLQNRVLRVQVPLNRTNFQNRLANLNERLGIMQQNLDLLREEIKLVRAEMNLLEKEIRDQAGDDDDNGDDDDDRGAPVQREEEPEQEIEIVEPREAMVVVEEEGRPEPRRRGRPRRVVQPDERRRTPPREPIQVEIIDPQNRIREDRDAELILDLPDVQIRRYNLRPDDVEFPEDPNIQRIFRPGAGRWRRVAPVVEDPVDQEEIVLNPPVDGRRGRGRPRIRGRGRGRPPGARNRDPLFRPGGGRRGARIRVVPRDEIDVIVPDDMSEEEIIDQIEERINPEEIIPRARGRGRPRGRGRRGDREWRPRRGGRREQEDEEEIHAAEEIYVGVERTHDTNFVGEVPEYPQIGRTVSSVATADNQIGQLEYVQIFEFNYLPRIQRYYEEEKRIFVILPSQNENRISETTNVYDRNYFQLVLPGDREMESRIYQLCDNQLNLLQNMKEFFPDPDPQNFNFSTTDYALQQIWNISTIINNEYDFQQIWNQINDNAGIENVVRTFLLNRNQYILLSEDAPEQGIFERQTYLLFQAAWQDNWQDDLSPNFYEWLNQQPVWLEFKCDFDKTMQTAEMFSNPADLLHFLTNLSFYQDGVAYDSEAIQSRFRYNTLILQQFTQFYNPANREQNRMDYIRLFKCDLIFTVRFVTLLAVMLNRDPDNNLKIRRAQIFFTGNLEADVINHIIEDENGDITSVRSSRIKGFPLVQIMSCLMEIINKPFQKSTYAHPDADLPGVEFMQDRIEELNRRKSQIYTRSADIQINSNKLLEKYYYRGQYNKENKSERNTQLSYVNGLRRNVRQPTKYNYQQAITTQIGQFAIQTRIVEMEDEFAVNVYDPHNFMKLAAVLNILLGNAILQSQNLSQIEVSQNTTWIRIDCMVYYEIDPHNGMEKIREKHFLGGSFKITPKFLKKITFLRLDDRDQQNARRRRLQISRFLLAKILRMETLDTRTLFGLPEDIESLERELDLDNVENEEIYESGVSLDELLEVYRRMEEIAREQRNSAERRKLRNNLRDDLEILDYGEEQRNNPETRRNPYQTRTQEGRVGFTATIHNINLVVYKRNENEKNQWWTIRSLVKNQMNSYTLNQGDWERVNRLNWQKEGKMHIHLRKFQCDLWTTIETIFSNYSCGQHLCIYLLCLGGFVSENDFIQNGELSQSTNVGDLVEFLENWSLFEVLFKKPLEIKKIIECLRPLQQNNNELIEIELFVMYNQARPLSLGKYKVDKKFQYLKLYFEKSHIIPVKDKDYQNAATENCGKPFDEKFQELFDQKKRPSYFVPVCVPQTKQNDKTKLKNQEVYENFERDVELHNFYRENFKERNIQTNKNYFCWIDLETTTKMNVKAMDKHKMFAYILACKFQCLDRSNNDPYGGIINDGDSWVFDGERCIELFLNKLKQIYFKILRDGTEKRKLIISAWNGRKFDFQFFIEKMYRMFPHNFILIGTMTNTKTAAIGEHIEFWDAMDMVSPMSLAKFCKSMQEPGKFDGSMMFKIKTMDDWTNLKINEPLKSKELIEYCLQDVICMSKSMTKFNEMIFGCLRLMLGDILKIENGNTPWILEKTMAKLSYKIFTNQIIPNSCAPQPVVSHDLYDAITQCYRGGFVLSFIFGKIDIKTNPHIKFLNYIDINSLYPFVMANSFIPVSYVLKPIKYDIVRNSHIDPRSIYKLTEFDIGEENHFGFFGVRVFNQQGKFTKVIYPTRWKSYQYQQQLWVFGTELILFRQVFGRGKFTIESFFECNTKKRLFRPIKLMYDKRMECKQSNPPQAESLKLMMNSCYGRFGMKAYELSSYIHELQLEEFSPEEQDFIIESNLRKHEMQQMKSNQFQREESPFENIQTIKTFNNDQILKFVVRKENTYLPNNKTQRLKHVAAWIATQARCRLLATIYQLRRETQVEVLYCDTDSIVYGAKTLNQMERVQNLKPFVWHKDNIINDTSFVSAVQFNNDLGGMKSEIEKGEEMIVFQAFGPKFYRYSKRKIGTTEEKWINKSKGINQNLRSVEDEKINGRMNDLRQILFFEEYQKSLNAQIYQQYIRSKRGQMFVEKTVKENRFNLTRKFSQNHPKNRELLNYTLPFADIDEYNRYAVEKIPVLDQNLNQYTYLNIE